MPAAKVTKTRLKNGLTVILKEVHTAPVISWWVWYRVGSRTERPGGTGISHWVEHMMFKGTQRFPGNYSDRVIARDGGVRNAMTWIDWTTYFATMPADVIRPGSLFHDVAIPEVQGELVNVMGRLRRGLAGPSGFVAHLGLPLSMQTQMLGQEPMVPAEWTIDRMQF